MLECILFSDDSILIKEARLILQKGVFDVSILPLSKIKEYKPLSSGVILIDIISIKDNALDFLKDIDVSLAAFKNKRLLILEEEQVEPLFSGIVRFDDYIYREEFRKDLLNRVRFNALGAISAPPADSILIDKMLLNLDKYELIVEGEIIVLTFKEFEMLKLLMQNKNKVFTRNNLLSMVWGYDYYGGSRTVDVHMRRLRSKIPPPYNNMLKTIRNVGYMFSPKY